MGNHCPGHLEDIYNFESEHGFENPEVWPKFLLVMREQVCELIHSYFIVYWARLCIVQFVDIMDTRTEKYVAIHLKLLNGIVLCDADQDQAD